MSDAATWAGFWAGAYQLFQEQPDAVKVTLLVAPTTALMFALQAVLVHRRGVRQDQHSHAQALTRMHLVHQTEEARLLKEAVAAAGAAPGSPAARWLASRHDYPKPGPLDPGYVNPAQAHAEHMTADLESDIAFLEWLSEERRQKDER